jgi:hypothetical protein
LERDLRTSGNLERTRVDPTKTGPNIAVTPAFIRNFLPWFKRNPLCRSSQISRPRAWGTGSVSQQAKSAAAEGNSER